MIFLNFRPEMSRTHPSGPAQHPSLLSDGEARQELQRHDGEDVKAPAAA